MGSFRDCTLLMNCIRNSEFITDCLYLFELGKKNLAIYLLTKIVSISLGQSMSISLTHIRQTSRSSGGTKELHKVKSLVAISPMSFQRAKMCLQSGPLKVS